jgi:hypothetical protein
MNSDCELLQDIEFVTPDGQQFYMDWSYRSIPPFYRHAKEVLGSELTPTPHRRSGPTDHMIFDRDIVEDFLATIERLHNKRPAWMVILEAVHPDDKDAYGMSEYELVFNWASTHFPERVLLRKLPADTHMKVHGAFVPLSEQYAIDVGYFRQKYDTMKLLVAVLKLARNRPARPTVEYMNMKFTV